MQNISILSASNTPESFSGIAIGAIPNLLFAHMSKDWCILLHLRVVYFFSTSFPDKPQGPWGTYSFVLK